MVSARIFVNRTRDLGALGNGVHVAIIVFGSQGREEPRGLVADLCPTCQKLRAFAVLDLYEVSHVYYVSMGRGKLRDTVMRCVECRTVCRFEPHKYAAVVPQEEADYYSSLEQLTRRTSPHLLGALLTEHRCPACGFRRPQPFRFCPQCGARGEN